MNDDNHVELDLQLRKSGRVDVTADAHFTNTARLHQVLDGLGLTDARVAALEADVEKLEADYRGAPHIGDGTTVLMIRAARAPGSDQVPLTWEYDEHVLTHEKRTWVRSALADVARDICERLSRDAPPEPQQDEDVRRELVATLFGLTPAPGEGMATFGMLADAALAHLRAKGLMRTPEDIVIASRLANAEISADDWSRRCKGALDLYEKTKDHLDKAQAQVRALAAKAEEANRDLEALRAANLQQAATISKQDTLLAGMHVDLATAKSAAEAANVAFETATRGLNEARASLAAAETTASEEAHKAIAAANREAQANQRWQAVCGERDEYHQRLAAEEQALAMERSEHQAANARIQVLERSLAEAEAAP